MTDDPLPFTEWSLTPEQWREREAEEPGVKRLLRAILGEALLNLETGLGCRRNQRTSGKQNIYLLYLDALGWVTDNNNEWPCSFLRVCDALSIDAQWLRALLLSRYPADPRTEAKHHVTKTRRVSRFRTICELKQVA